MRISALPIPAVPLERHTIGCGRGRSRDALFRYVALSLAGTLIAGLGGCAGYELGSTLPPGVKSLHVPTFINRCGEPLLETETTRATLQEFYKDGTLRTTGPGQADAVLEVTLVGYDLEPLRYEKDKVRKTKEYRLTITADIVFRETKTGKILVRKQVEGETTFISASGLSASKRKALPQAARDLAHDIVESVVECW